MTNSPILATRGLGKQYGARRHLLRPPDPGTWAVHSIDLEVERGSTLGIVGESGSGKTTLARMVAGLIRPTTGTVLLEGDATDTMAAHTLHQSIQYVYQDPYSSLNPRKTIGQSIAVPLRFLAGQSRAERRRNVAKLLDVSGLRPEFAMRYPHELSGGQRQRVVVARAMAVHPEILVLDEPVSALDVSIQAQILTLLRDLQREFNMTYLFISHDLAVVEALCDHIAVMREGSIVERGTREDIFTRARDPYTQRLLAAIPGTRPRVTTKGGNACR